MSKSATEQYQIKKKRKPNQINNHKNLKNSLKQRQNHRLNILSTTLATKTIPTPTTTTPTPTTTSTELPTPTILTHFDENSCFDYIVRYKNCLRDQRQIQNYRNIVKDTTETTSTSTPTTTLNLIKLQEIVEEKEEHTREHREHKKMPLSQGYYVKSALTTKRGLMLKVVEAKRRTMEQHYNNNNNNHNNNYNYNNNNNNHETTPAAATISATNNGRVSDANNAVNPIPMTTNLHKKNYINMASTTIANTNVATATSVAGTGATGATNLPPPPTLQQRQQHQQHPQQQQQQQYYYNQNVAHNSLEILYLLGESFADCGKLQKAFNIFEIIASRQHDGYIPLDKLNILTHALIEHIRQLGSSNEYANNEDGAEMTITMDTTSKFKRCRDNTLETMLKARYMAQREHTLAWQTSTTMASLPTLNTSDGGNGNEMGDKELHLLDLHAPTRELSIPSPVLSDDYDPLLCPLCRDILRCPVTTNCGHTFCRQCCETITMCNICHIKFPRVLTAPEMSAAQQNCVGNNGTSMATTTTITSSSSSSTTSRFYNGFDSTSRSSIETAPPPPPSTTPSVEGNFNFGIAYSNVSTQSAIGRLSLPPITVTTTTVASTTATATTTMAATGSSTALGVVGFGVGVVASRGTENIKFMPDVLVRRLVEKWWGADLQAKKLYETAASYMHSNLLDNALKYCNKSLEKLPTDFKSLCLRAEVFLKFSHFQSSLADVENALKARCISAKAHYLRALALSGLGRLDEALYDSFLAIYLDKTTNLSSSEIFQHDLAKILQRLLAQTPKCKPPEQMRSYTTKTPYSMMLWDQRIRRKKLGSAHSVQQLGAVISDENLDDVAFVAAYEKQCDYISATEEAEESLFANALDYMDKRDMYAQEYEREARRHATRKHCRRKWPTKSLGLELLPPPLEHVLDRSRSQCSQRFRGIIERSQHELQRLRNLESSIDAPHKQLTPVPAPLIDASDFECVLCSRTLWKPVVTPCGHTYCSVCLDRCMDYNSQCPLCMSPLVELNVNNIYQGSSSPVPFALAKRPVTKFLEAAMKRFIPDIYETRFRQEIDMEPSVPVFICTTAFPCVPCPLFVYEPRYRLMVRRAVESGEKTFGIVQSHSGKTRYFDVGTILDIRDCVLLSDGCSILSTIGCKRFKILTRSEKDGYETAKVEYICDEPIADENVKFVAHMHELVLNKAEKWFNSLSTELKQEILQSFGEMPPLEHNWEVLADGPAWAWWIIALLPLSQQLKVDILATTSLEKRLRAIEKTLDYLTGSYRKHQQQQLHHHHHQQQQHGGVTLIECDDDADVVEAADVGVEGAVGGAAAVTVMNDDDVDDAASDECCLRTNNVNVVSVSAGVEACASSERLLL